MSLNSMAAFERANVQNSMRTKIANLQMPIVGLGMLFISILTLIDVISDLKAGASFSHLVSEFTTIVICTMGAVWFLRQIKILSISVKSATLETEQVKAEAVKWRREAENHIRGVGEAIDKQLKLWQLSPSESEITFLMLKGLSYQNIADLRGVSERTVRQQAASVLKKSSLTSRTELAAFFLEDLLPPDQSKINRL